MSTDTAFHIEQFEDKGLSHFSYAIVFPATREIALIDPARDPQPYFDFARRAEARIVAVIETHPHADFISSHLEIHRKTGAQIYCSALTGAAYPHKTFDEGDVIPFGDAGLRAINTPGHSPDSISIVLENSGSDYAVFTGDTLFIGDCGRPDLRESAGNLTARKEELARKMYHSLRDKFLPLRDDVLVYPAHGAGSLCGKALSDATRSTIGAEKISNWCLRETDEAAFVRVLLSDQPFVPHYFAFDVELNRRGAADLAVSLQAVDVLPDVHDATSAKALQNGVLIIDTRPEAVFKAGHLPGAINLMAGGKFESWLGSIVKPGEPLYLAAESTQKRDELLRRCAKIGYEEQLAGTFVLRYGNQVSDGLDIVHFRENPDGYTIVDIRNRSEISEKTIFPEALEIPLPELRDHMDRIPSGKPIVVHCAGGYRSAAGASIIESRFGSAIPVYDLGVAIHDFPAVQVRSI
ncbi:MAG: MBL fold metallo-hydrolase [Mucilaginibacter polytrichastri]|nr:MBL fold metallo-hydrolase [Mucilaginibacter polytrichastri]